MSLVPVDECIIYGLALTSKYLGVYKSNLVYRMSYHKEGDHKVHALSINFGLNSSDLIKDNCSLTSIYNEEESGKQHSSE
jgi:hypothetical protein